MFQSDTYYTFQVIALDKNFSENYNSTYSCVYFSKFNRNAFERKYSVCLFVQKIILFQVTFI